MVMSKGIWVINNGFSKQRLANHVVKLETLTSCLQELFLQCEFAAGLGIKRGRPKETRMILSHFQLRANFALLVNLTGLLRQYLLLAYSLTPRRKLHFKDLTLLSPLGAIVLSRTSVQGRTHFWVTTAGASCRVFTNFQPGVLLGMSGNSAHLGCQIHSIWDNWHMDNCCSDKQDHHFGCHYSIMPKIRHTLKEWNHPKPLEDT